MEANRRHALDLQRRHAYQQLANTSTSVPGGRVPNSLFREHTFTVLRLLKNVMDWHDEEESQQNGRNH